MKFSHSMIIRFMSRKSYPISLLALSSRSRSKFRSLVGVELFIRHVSTNVYQNHFLSNRSIAAIDSSIAESTTHSVRRCTTSNTFNCFSLSSKAMALSIDQRGAQNSTDYRIYFSESFHNLINQFLFLKIFHSILIQIISYSLEILC